MNNELTGGQIVAIAEARIACKGEPDITERIKKAMRATKDHWMEREEGRQFKAALAGALLETSDQKEKERIIESTQVLNKMDATMYAAMQGLVVVSGDDFMPKNVEDILPLLGMWKEIR